MNILQFSPFSSSISVTFWNQLRKLKIEKFKLSEETQNIFGYYKPGSLTPVSFQNLPSDFILEDNAFSQNPIPKKNATIASKDFYFQGKLILLNTIEQFKQFQFSNLLNQEGENLFKSINSDEALKNPEILNRFFIISYGDMKKFSFYYWVCFPALCFEVPISFSKISKIDEILNSEEQSQIDTSFNEIGCPHFFLIKNFKSNKNEKMICDSKIENFQENEEIILGFVDPCSLTNGPGWPLRNFLFLIAKKFSPARAKVLCKRKGNISLIIDIEFPKEMNFEKIPKVTGFEKHQGKLQPRSVNLSSTMDPTILAENSSSLNLQLMKWRLIPELDLEKISNTKCLLLGSGTLGCNVARNLISWGVKNITFLDNGKVSYSNPVRQSLFTFEDSVKAKPKSIAAAEGLKRISPSTNSEGIQFSIPMPGHPISEEEILNSTKTFEKLFNDHDVIFVLTDSRESRWFPTLLGASKGKFVINAALGFDSYLVVRHGIDNHLGCYFCNDVVAPQNSLKDRTLDQQCTVTRPGLSMICSAFAVELMVGCLQSKLGARSKSFINSETSESILGSIPQSIRGFLNNMNSVSLSGSPYEKCTACSKIVVGEYQKENIQFLKKVYNSPNYLEDLTGLTEMKEMKIDWEPLDNEDEFDME